MEEIMEEYDEFGNPKKSFEIGGFERHYLTPKSDLLGIVLTESNQQVLLGLMTNALSIRNVALIGHLWHGKTSFMDMLVIKTHYVPSNVLNDHFMKSNPLRFTDMSNETSRGMSMEAVPMTFVLKNSEDQSYLCNIVDVPGHVEFSDEMTAALRLADGAAVIVDAAEGVMLNTKRAIKHAIKESLPIVLIINKIDKLITEESLYGAYDKFRKIIEDVNLLITSTAGGARIIDPLVGNVCFTSSTHGWSFTLQSFSKLYVKRHKVPIDALQFASHLWGDNYFQRDTLAFMERPSAAGESRSFVQFILEPLYKIYSIVNSTERQVSVLQKALGELGVEIPDSAFSLTFSHRLSLACCSAFGSATGFTDMVAQHIPSAKEAAASKVELLLSGPQNSPVFNAVRDCDPSGPLMVNVTKLYPKELTRYDTVFDALGRVYSGEVQTGQTVRVLREDITRAEMDDLVEKQVTNMWICQGRYRIPVTRAPAGSLVLIEGVDAFEKTATLTDMDSGGDVYPFWPLRFNTLPLAKIVIGPLDPYLTTSGFRMIRQKYPLAIITFEKPNVCTISGTGSLYLGCIKADLRHYYKSIWNTELEVSGHTVSFRETVAQSSLANQAVQSCNKQNQITMVAEPLAESLAESFENGVISTWQQNLPATTSSWAFGPDKQGPNVLLAEALPSEVDESLLKAVKKFIVEGFQFGASEGPLCDEPIRNVMFRIVDAKISPELLHRTGSQIFPTARQAAYSAFLVASPRLMEPVFHVEIQTPIHLVSHIQQLLSRRRGNVIVHVPQHDASPCVLKALLPAIESFTFEHELTGIANPWPRQVSCLFVFDHWALVPGDPLQTSTLAHEFVLQTKRRKGKSEDDAEIS